MVTSLPVVIAANLSATPPIDCRAGSSILVADEAAALHRHRFAAFAAVTWSVARGGGVFVGIVNGLHHDAQLLSALALAARPSAAKVVRSGGRADEVMCCSAW